jgi:hypothetical protein
VRVFCCLFEAGIGHLENCEGRYRESKREALFWPLILCARFLAVIPEWAADAIIDGETALNSGDFLESGSRQMGHRR